MDINLHDVIYHIPYKINLLNKVNLSKLLVISTWKIVTNIYKKVTIRPKFLMMFIISVKEIFYSTDKSTDLHEKG